MHNHSILWAAKQLNRRRCFMDHDHSRRSKRRMQMKLFAVRTECLPANWFPYLSGCHCATVSKEENVFLQSGADGVRSSTPRWKWHWWELHREARRHTCPQLTRKTLCHVPHATRKIMRDVYGDGGNTNQKGNVEWNTKERAHNCCSGTAETTWGNQNNISSHLLFCSPLCLSATFDVLFVLIMKSFFSICVHLAVLRSHHLLSLSQRGSVAITSKGPL